MMHSFYFVCVLCVGFVSITSFRLPPVTEYSYRESTSVELLSLEHPLSYRQRRSDDCSPDHIGVRFTADNIEVKLSLQRNYDINVNAPLFVNINGTITQESLENSENVAVYQDLESGSAILVQCVPSTRKFELFGTFYNGSEELMIEPELNEGQEEFPAASLDDVQSRDAKSMKEQVSQDQDLNEKFTISPHAIFKGKTMRPKESDFILKEGLHPKYRAGSDHSARVKRAITAYQVELLMVADYSAYSFWLQNSSSSAAAKVLLRQFYAFVLNGIDLRYKSLTGAGFTITVLFAGLYIAETPSDALWTESRKFLSGSVYQVNASDALDDFGSWTRSSSNLPGHDHAMLFTAHDLEVNGNNAVAGLAYLGAACTTYSHSIVEDNFDAQLMTIAAHELGHSLGAWHDGTPDSTGNSCSPTLAYIMSASVTLSNLGTSGFQYNKNLWKFSPCSTSYFQTYINTLNSTNCLTTLSVGYNSTALSPYDQQNPGQVYSADTQCRYRQGNDSYLCRNIYRGNYTNLCTAFYCQISGSSYCSLSIAAERTTCGDRKWCVAGECVTATEAPSVNDTCPFGNQPGIVANGQTCTQLVANSSFNCYNYAGSCCESCQNVYTGIIGCEYGDKAVGCIAGNCAFYGNTTLAYCCKTCYVPPTTTATTKSPTTTTATYTTSTTAPTTTSTTTVRTTTTTAAPIASTLAPTTTTTTTAAITTTTTTSTYPKATATTAAPTPSTTMTTPTATTKTVAPTPTTTTVAQSPTTTTAASTPTTTTAALTPTTTTAALTPGTTTSAPTSSTTMAAPTSSTTTAAPAPSTTSAAPTPGITTAAPTPSTSTAAPTPSTTTAAQTPSTSTAAPTPSTTTAAPTISTTTAAPTPSTLTAAPTPSTTTAAPTQGTTTAAPTPSTSTAAPYLSATTAATTPSTSTAAPTSSTTMAAPSPSTSTATPTPSTTTAAPTQGTTTAAPTPSTSTAAPTPNTTTAAPTSSTTAAAPTSSTTTAAPTSSTTRAAPTSSTTRAAPTPSTSTAAPTPSTTTAAPTPSTSTAAPTQGTTTAAPTPSTSTAAPTPSTTTAAPTTSTTTAAPTPTTTTAAPTSSTTTAAPTPNTSTAVPTPSTTTAAPTPNTTTAAPTSNTTTAAPTSSTTMAAPTPSTSTAAPTTSTTTAATTPSTSTAAPTQGTTTAAPTPSTTTVATTQSTIRATPTPSTTTADPTPSTSTAAPIPRTTTAAPTPSTSTAAPTPSTTMAAPTPNTTTAAPTSSTTTAAPTPSTSTAAPTPSTTMAAPTPSTTTAAPTPTTTTAASTPSTSTAAPTPTTTTAAPTPSMSTMTIAFNATTIYPSTGTTRTVASNTTTIVPTTMTAAPTTSTTTTTAAPTTISKTVFPSTPISITPSTTNTTTEQQGTKKTAVTVRLGYNVSSADNLSDSSTYSRYVDIVGETLREYYTRKVGQDTQINIRDIRRGSLIVEYDVIIKNIQTAQAALAKANIDLAAGENITVGGQVSGVESMIVENMTVPIGDSSKDQLCTVYVLISGGCPANYKCVVFNSSPMCQPNKTTIDIVPVTVAAAVAGLVIAIAVVALICSLQRRSKNRAKHLANLSTDNSTESQMKLPRPVYFNEGHPWHESSNGQYPNDFAHAHKWYPGHGYSNTAFDGGSGEINSHYYYIDLEH